MKALREDSTEEISVISLGALLAGSSFFPQTPFGPICCGVRPLEFEDSICIRQENVPTNDNDVLVFSQSSGGNDSEGFDIRRLSLNDSGYGADLLPSSAYLYPQTTIPTVHEQAFPDYIPSYSTRRFHAYDEPLEPVTDGMKTPPGMERVSFYVKKEDLIKSAVQACAKQMFMNAASKEEAPDEGSVSQTTEGKAPKVKKEKKSSFFGRKKKSKKETAPAEAVQLRPEAVRRLSRTSSVYSEGHYQDCIVPDYMPMHGAAAATIVSDPRLADLADRRASFNRNQHHPQLTVAEGQQASGLNDDIQTTSQTRRFVRRLPSAESGNPSQTHHLVRQSSANSGNPSQTHQSVRQSSANSGNPSETRQLVRESLPVDDRASPEIARFVRDPLSPRKKGAMSAVAKWQQQGTTQLKVRDGQSRRDSGVPLSPESLPQDYNLPTHLLSVSLPPNPHSHHHQQLNDTYLQPIQSRFRPSSQHQAQYVNSSEARDAMYRHAAMQSQSVAPCRPESRPYSPRADLYSLSPNSHSHCADPHQQPRRNSQSPRHHSKSPRSHSPRNYSPDRQSHNQQAFGNESSQVDSGHHGTSSRHRSHHHSSQHGSGGSNRGSPNRDSKNGRSSPVDSRVSDRRGGSTRRHHSTHRGSKQYQRDESPRRHSSQNCSPHRERSERRSLEAASNGRMHSVDSRSNRGLSLQASSGRSNDYHRRAEVRSEVVGHSGRKSSQRLDRTSKQLSHAAGHRSHSRHTTKSRSKSLAARQLYRDQSSSSSDGASSASSDASYSLL